MIDPHHLTANGLSLIMSKARLRRYVDLTPRRSNRSRTQDCCSWFEKKVESGFWFDGRLWRPSLSGGQGGWWHWGAKTGSDTEIKASFASCRQAPGARSWGCADWAWSGETCWDRMAERFLSILVILRAKVVLTRRWVWTVISFVHHEGFFYLFFIFYGFLFFSVRFRLGRLLCRWLPRMFWPLQPLLSTTNMDPPTFAGRWSKKTWLGCWCCCSRRWHKAHQVFSFVSPFGEQGHWFWQQ